MKKELWTAEDELEYQMGDMHGIVFKRDEAIGCDKPHHLERSIAHQRNHLKSKRVKKILKKTG